MPAGSSSDSPASKPGPRTAPRASSPARRPRRRASARSRLRATVVMLAAMLMSRRATLTLLRDMFGAQISLGSLENILKQASDALAAPWQAIQQAVQAADVAHADETSWARAGQRLWLWSALSATAACYRIDETRARSAARALLGEFDGLLITIATASMTSSTPNAAKSAFRIWPETSRRSPNATVPAGATDRRSGPRSTTPSALIPRHAATATHRPGTPGRCAPSTTV